MRCRMGQERARAALERIERALSRIEAAASAPALASTASDPDAAPLREAHLALRGKVETAIAQIDRLIEREAG